MEKKGLGAEGFKTPRTGITVFLYLKNNFLMREFLGG